MRRLASIDIARGLVMVIMALDHTRDLLHINAVVQSPTDLTTTTPLLFFTRWVTHLCAPSFVFLSGISAYLALKAGSPARFLLTRGIWLIIVEFTLVNFAMSFDVHFRLFLFEVIATIGAGFILLYLLCRLSPAILAAIGLALVFGHDLASLIPSPSNGFARFVLTLFFSPGAFPLPGGRLFVVAYPILPWLGIMLLGFASGRFFERSIFERKRIFLRLGLASIALFLVIRGVNVYGDPAPWAVQKTGVLTVLSFLNLTKYPVSLSFSLCMLGILMGVLWLAEGGDNRLTRVLQVYGRTPLFYFIIHFFLIHSLMLFLVLAQGHSLSDLPFGPFLEGRPTPHWGLSLGWVYGIWGSVVVTMFPLCRWYGAYKARHKEWWWLRYL